MLKKLKKAIGIFQWLLTAVLVLAVLLLIFTAFNPIKTFQLFRVMSGSMEPKIKVGSVVFVRKVKPEGLKKGDVITYTSSENPEMSITHRLVEIEEKEGKTVFKTRGDANNNEDMAEVSPSEIKGKVVFSLPFLGYLSVWIKKPLGFGLLVILPALLIILSEILSIKKAIEKEVEKKYEEKEKLKEKKVTASLLILFLLGVSLLRIKPAEAYFSDVVVMGGNTFSMASDWVSPTPSPTVSPAPSITPTPAPVVINEVYYGATSSAEWVELYNAGNAPVDLKGWSIQDNTQTDVLSTISLILLPGQFAVMVGTNNSAQVIAPDAIKIILGNTAVGNGLAKDGDRLILKSNLGNIIDQMNYGDDTGVWNPARAGVVAGHSLARSPKGYDTNQPSDFVDLATPNPGTNPHPPDLTEPTPTPSPVPETSSTPETSPTPEPNPTVEPTPAPSVTPTPLPSPEPSPTVSPEPSPSPTPTPTSESSFTPSQTPSSTQDATPIPLAESSLPTTPEAVLPISADKNNEIDSLETSQ
jgi:signal peptidase